MEGRDKINLNRRKMIGVLGWIALVALAGLWDLMIKRDQLRSKGRKLKILLADIPMGITYYSEYYIIRNPGGIRVFSMKCTHLGCRLQQSPDGHLVCPCHGSAFDPQSRAVLKGPAVRPPDMLESGVEGDFLMIKLN